MLFFSIDIETTGIDWKKFGITEFSAVAADLYDPSVPHKAFTRWLAPDGYNWSQYCLKLHYKWIEIMNNRALEGFRGEPKVLMSYRELLQEFRDWLNDEFKITTPPPDALDERSPDWDRIVCAGKNFGTFDLNFLTEKGFPRAMFDPRILDPGPFYVRRGDKVPPAFKICKERAITEGVSFPSVEVAHSAEQDALDVITLLHHAYRDRP